MTARGTETFAIQSRIVLRERTILDVFDLALRFMVENGRLYAIIAAAVVLPAYVLTCAAGSTLGWGWGWCFAFVLAMLAQGPFTLLASRLVFESRVRARDVLLAALRASPRHFGAQLVVALLVAGGALLFFLPAIWLATIFRFVSEVVALEESSTLSALGRSQRIVNTQSGEGLLAVLLSLLFAFASVVIVGDIAGRRLLSELLEVRPPPGLFDAGGNFLAAFGFWLFVPFHATARFLLYVNFRTRSEGWDVQTRFFALATRAEPRNLG
jgi:hypothetical protein